MQQPGFLSVPQPPEKSFLPEAEGETQHFAPGDVESRTLHCSASHPAPSPLDPAPSRPAEGLNKSQKQPKN